jgi:hypothetical protein
MTTAQTEPASPKPLLLWPGIAAAVLQVALRFGLPIVAPDTGPLGGIAGLLCALFIFVWWTLLSRAPRWERWGAIVVLIVALAATSRIIHESIATGMMGMMFYVYAIPIASLALVAWAVARGLAVAPRRAAMVASIVLACAVFALLRTDGILGGGGSQLAWRWAQTAEERLLAQAADEPLLAAGAKIAAGGEPTAPQPDTSASPASQSIDAASKTTPPTAVETTEHLAAGRVDEQAPAPFGSAAIESGSSAPASSELASRAAGPAADWPGFRGPHRDGVSRGAPIETDWSKSPPVELWRRPVGPGWSSFAVHGDLIYTQEQRGDGEVVACYNLTTGEPVWRHSDTARFWESNAGAGPRSTPTLSNGRVYTFGATGILNALDARSGALVWTRNAAADTAAEIPYWGFSSSPLVVDDVVIAAVAGQLAAYDLASGEPRWTGPAQGSSYSSPHRLTIGGVTQIVLLTGSGAISVEPATGKMLWEHPWEGFASLQPAITADGDLLISTSGNTGGLGMRRLAIAQRPGSQPTQKEQSQSTQEAPAGWTVEERWTSPGLKPYFNDFVVHNNHAYGFDGRILSCIDLAGGERKWKGGRYGNGQLVLLPDQNALLVLSDEGELALVAATPEKFTELARFPAIDGKTWNHPVLVGDIVLVRNDQQMAAFRLAGGENKPKTE